MSYSNPRCSKTKNLEWHLKEVTLKKGEKFRESLNIYLQNICVPDARNCVNSRELGLFMQIESQQIPEHWKFRVASLVQAINFQFFSMKIRISSVTSAMTKITKLFKVKLSIKLSSASWKLCQCFESFVTEKHRNWLFERKFHFLAWMFALHAFSTWTIKNMRHKKLHFIWLKWTHGSYNTAIGFD